MSVVLWVDFFTWKPAGLTGFWSINKFKYRTLAGSIVLSYLGRYIIILFIYYLYYWSHGGRLLQVPGSPQCLWITKDGHRVVFELFGNHMGHNWVQSCPSISHEGPGSSCYYNSIWFGGSWDIGARFEVTSTWTRILNRPINHFGRKCTVQCARSRLRGKI